MKKTYLLSFICLICCSAVWAQQKEYRGKMSATPLRLEQKGDSLYIGIEFDFSGVTVDSRRSISLIPVVATAQTELMLPQVMVKGRANYLTSKRELALMSKSERKIYDMDAPYAIVKGYKNDEGDRIMYSTAVPFELWMKDARLDIREDLCGCGNAPRSLDVSQLVNRVKMEQIVPYVVAPLLAYVEPIAETVKRREIDGAAFLDFVVSKTDIRPDYMNNPEELKKITDMMEELRNDPAVTVNRISVIGYASPEGALKFNRYLSESRANALVDYLLPRFDCPIDLYYIESGGENWRGLLDVVNVSQMKYKDQVIGILTDGTIGDEARKTKLKQLQDGEPYRYMLKEFYPSLRKAICKMAYEVKNFDAEETAKVFGTHPQHLSLNEMFAVANRYEAGSPEFVEVFETAARIFPLDDTANLNAACAALSRRDTASAERYLTNVKTKSAEYDNAMGVLMMLRGKYGKAEEFLASASRSGLEAANRNLDELRKKLENQKFINERSPR